MSAKDPSQPTPLPVVFGLAVTGCLLYVLSLLAQSWLRLATWGDLHPQLGLLAYVILFYIAAVFVSHGTRQRPEQPAFVITNVSVHAFFLAGGWLLWRGTVPLTWALLALAFSAFLQVGTFILARMRERSVERLLQSPTASYDGAVAWCFALRSSTYMALPFGAALAPLLGAIAGADASALLRHCVAGAFVGAALAAGKHAFADNRWLTRAGITQSSQASLLVSARSLPDAYELEILLPRDASSEQAAEAARLASKVREAVLFNQLQRLMLSAACVLVAAQLELDLSMPASAAVLLSALLLLTTLLPYAIGEQRARGVPRLPPLPFWLGLAVAVQLGLFAALAAAPIVRGLFS